MDQSPSLVAQPFAKPHVADQSEDNEGDFDIRGEHSVSFVRLILATAVAGCVAIRIFCAASVQPGPPLAGIYQKMDDQDVRDLLNRRRYPQALERLLDLYGTKVYRMALMFLKDPGRAEEVTQDVFLRIWQRADTFQPGASPGTWLYTIARNTCLGAARSEAYRGTASIDGSNEPVVPATISRDVELAQCLDRLPEIQREVITLFYLQEKSVQDVAVMLNLPVNTVKSHLHRARKALAALLQEQK